MNTSAAHIASYGVLDADEISVVLPALNEAGNIGALVAELRHALPRSVLAEIIVVDDGSDDGTAEEVKALIGTIEGLRYLRHAKTCGQSAAVRTGVRAARTMLVATLDGDGQNDPRDLAALLKRLQQPDAAIPALVGGIRTTRRAESSKRLASVFANWLRDAVLGDGCPDTGCGIKLFRRDVFLDLPFFSGMHRYLPALFITYGHGVAYVAVNDRVRRSGKSKYSNFGRAILGIYDLIGVRWLRRRTILPHVAEEHGASVPARANASAKLSAHALYVKGAATGHASGRQANA